MFGVVDLHTHTICSDGRLTPRALVQKASEKGLRGLAITDHDTIAGLAEGAAVARRKGLHFIPGVELSITLKGREVHVLAYGIDPSSPVLAQYFERLRQIREARAQEILEQLAREKVPVSWEVVTQIAGHAPVGRPHIAQALVESGQVSSYQEAFARYLGDHAPAGLPKKNPSPEEAFAVIREAGGCAVLAHPGNWTSEEDIQVLVAYGLWGIEVWHPSHDVGLVHYYTALAKRYQLVPTGGSDYHGRHAYEEENFGRYGVSLAQIQSWDTCAHFINC